jgi:hypothetical protein
MGTGVRTPTRVPQRVEDDATKKRTRAAVGRRQGTTGAEADGDEGVGGPRTSDEAGKRLAPKPAEQRRPVSETSSRREP